MRLKPYHMLGFLAVALCVGVVEFLVYLGLAGAAIAIGDSTHPVLSFPHGLALMILSFPMMYVYVPIGDWLEPYLTDNGVLCLFAALNAAFWGLALTAVAAFLLSRIGRGRHEHRSSL
jgi:hypothetical protein